MMTAVERRWGRDEAVDVGRKLFAGIGWIAAERLVAVLDLDDSLSSIATVLRTCHLMLIADYPGLTITRPGADEIVVTDAPALAEGDPFSLSGLLDLGAEEILASTVGGVNARARVEALAGDGLGPGVRAAWRITLDPAGPPMAEPKSVEIVRFSTGPHLRVHPPPAHPALIPHHRGAATGRPRRPHPRAGPRLSATRSRTARREGRPVAPEDGFGLDR